MNDLSTPKPFACKANGCGLSFTNEDHLQVHEKKHEMILNLGLEQKSGNIFVADQTPTPTRLIKNCEEVGLFDDLRHVNPFDETFRRAVEQKTQPLSTTEVQNEISSSSHDSLHTPQVFPVTESTESGIPCQRLPITPSVKPLPTPTNLTNVQSLSEPPKEIKTLPMILPKQVNKPQTTIQLIQPQVITLNFPTPVISTVPVQTVKPFILPKSNTETSTASTTLASALPIKERLKAILNSNSKRSLSENNNSRVVTPPKKTKPKHTFDDDCMVRRRAAAERYRNKIKKEHVDLRKKNSDLATENAQLKEIIKQLRLDLARHQNCCPAAKSMTMNAQSEIQIPPSTVRLVMSIPKLVIQPTGQTVMQNPVTFAVEKL
ncbi:cyclic AMP-dependent transcription factor ATF-2 [Episyrphus balteatus]|uniref:cyclic AMP-dependent transcription factor ATF-2 n=1 Tax=Episyrphus balteatus TaxID=286459 RepID=UPI002485E72A|nr:cyclic AMP-dependent transcription factor ATF-2 [Episyrphus balteatus]